MDLGKLNDRMVRLVLIAGIAIVIAAFSGLVAFAIFEAIKPAL